MTDIEWVEPPPKLPRPRGVRQLFVAALKERPGVWARWPHPAVDNVGTQFKRTFPGVEATTRTREDGRHDVYLRWVGPA